MDLNYTFNASMMGKKDVFDLAKQCSILNSGIIGAMRNFMILIIALDIIMVIYGDAFNNKIEEATGSPDLGYRIIYSVNLLLALFPILILFGIE